MSRDYGLLLGHAVDRIRKAAGRLIHDFPWRGSRTDTRAREQELERLAHAVLQYGKMKHQFYQDELTIVDVTELAFRFREPIRAVVRALKLLETRGLAEPTGLPQLWKLYVAGLDRQPHGGSVRLGQVTK